MPLWSRSCRGGRSSDQQNWDGLDVHFCGRNLDLFQSYDFGGVYMGPSMAGGEEIEE